MLAIRMQRTGRKGHANFRVIVQNSAQSPTSGKVVAQLGSYDPHTKATVIDKDKAAFYLEHGARPSDRTAMLLKKEGVKLPTWVEAATKKAAGIRHPEKLRRNRPEEPKAAEAPAEEPTTEVADVVEAAEVPVETPVAEAETPVTEVVEAEAPAEEAPVEAEKVSESVAEEAAPEAEAASDEPAAKTE
jgi:small subunit ribosomal protein S16